MSSFYVSEPLPHYKHINNQIYNYFPNEKELAYELTVANVRKSKVTRKHSIRKNRRLKPKLSSPIPKSLSSSSMNNLSICGFSSSDDASDYKESDLESLPDLMDDIETPDTSVSSPLSIRDHYMYLDKPKTILNSIDMVQDSELENSEEEFVHNQFQQHLYSKQPNNGPLYPKVNIFEIPEIVYKIVEFASYQDDKDPSPIRRKPDSYNHALLIHGNKKIAEETSNPPQTTTPSNCTIPNRLYNCLHVNKLFNQVTKEIISQRFCFDNDVKLCQYLSTIRNTIRPKEFKLSKIFHLSSSKINWQMFNFDNLTDIEIFMCPKFLPPIEMFHTKIKSLVICGSKVLDDNYLIEVARRCPNLTTLDLRGCEMITDSSIYHIALHCGKLETINFGRKHRGHLITDSSIGKLIKNNLNLNTIGLAGCHITDKTIWDIAVYLNYNVTRLSLNNCTKITNQSIPIILMADYFHNLNVLELKNTNIDNFKTIIEFKRNQEFKGIPVLIEVCEALCLKMRQQEIELDKIISQRIFKDIQDWANDDNDGDVNYLNLLNRTK